MALNRREVLKGLGAAALLNAIPRSAEAQEQGFKYFSSELTPQRLEAQKRATIDSLANSIPPLRQLEYLRAYLPYLAKESQMYIPDTAELKEVVARNEHELDRLTAKIPMGRYGLFLFADAHGEKTRQRMYVLKKGTIDSAQFVKAYKVSMSREGFGNEPDSNKTPLDLHAIHSKALGMFGEVMSKKKKYKDNPRLFKHVKIGDDDHWFIHSLGYETGNEMAEVVTDQYLISGPQTSTERGVRIHGTNRSGGLDKNREWISYLDGESMSSACIRMSNVDVRDLNVHGYVDIQTPVMISATPEAQKAAERYSAPPDPSAEWTPSE